METNKTNNQKEQANKDQQNIQIKNTQLNQNKKKESNNSANFKENTEKHMNSKKENNNNQAVNSEPKLANLNNNSNNMVTSNNQLENQDKLKKKKKKKKKTKKILAQELAQRQREAELFNTTPKQKIYLSYRSRLIINVILCIVFLFISVNFIYNSMDIIKEENVTYSEKGTIDYKICLKENNFYESSCIDKDMSYIASLIKNIPLTFTYDFKTSKSIKLDAKYEVTANLVISNTEDSTNYFSKKYVLIPLTDINENDSSYKLINQDINIDYEYYNNIANEFRSQYGVETRIWKQGEQIPFVGRWNQEISANSLYMQLQTMFSPQILDCFLQDYEYQKDKKTEAKCLDDLIDDIFPFPGSLSPAEKKILVMQMEKRIQRFLKDNSFYSNKKLPKLRSRILSLFTDVSKLMASVSISGLKLSDLPSQELIILEQLFSHVHKIVEEMGDLFLVNQLPIDDLLLSLEGMEDTFDDIQNTIKTSIDVNTYKNIKIIE